MAKPQFADIQAAVTDGRTRNVYYRQTQLLRLHKNLVQEADNIITVIKSDTGNSRTEAIVEYSLALSVLKERNAELDPEQELRDEYSVAKGQDAARTRVGVGVVFIQAQTEHTPFFSVIAPLSAAIAAGNCVIIQVRYPDQ